MKKKTILTEKEVRHVAHLAQLSLTTKELKKFQKQLSSILNFVSKLEKVNTKKIEPTNQVTGLENVFRKDKVKASLTQEETLANAPDQYKGFFKVKSIF